MEVSSEGQAGITHLVIKKVNHYPSSRKWVRGFGKRGVSFMTCGSRGKSIMNCGGGQKEFQMSMNWIRTKRLHLAHVYLLETWFKHCSMLDASEHTVPVIWEVSFIYLLPRSQEAVWLTPSTDPSPFQDPTWDCSPATLDRSWKPKHAFSGFTARALEGVLFSLKPPFSLDLFNAY